MVASRERRLLCRDSDAIEIATSRRIEKRIQKVEQKTSEYGKYIELTDFRFSLMRQNDASSSDFWNLLRLKPSFT